MAGRHVLNGAEGAAWLLQLGSMIRVLEQHDQAASRECDREVIALIASLHEAHAAAAEIAKRPAILERRGVDLVKH